MLVFDSSPLTHFARADELETLRDLVKDFDRMFAWATRVVVRSAVLAKAAINITA